MIFPQELERNNEKVKYHRQLAEQDLQRLFTMLFRNPSRNTDIVQILLERYPNLIKDN